MKTRPNVLRAESRPVSGSSMRSASGSSMRSAGVSDSVAVVPKTSDTESVSAFLARTIFAEPVPARGDLTGLRARLVAIGANGAPPEDGTLRAVVYLLDGVVTALHADTAKHDPHFWERVLEAHDVVHDFRGDARKRCRVLEATKWAAQHWNDRRGLDPSVSDPREVRFSSLLTSLSYCDTRFERLDENFAREVIEQLVKQTPQQKEKHGRGHIDINGAAARLAVKVGAFGDSDEAKSAQAFRNAAKPPGKRSPKP